MLQITTQRTTTPKAKPDEGNLGFGVHYTDHMLIIDHDEEKGWHDARIVPYQPLELDPAAADPVRCGRRAVSAARARSCSDGFPLRNGVL